MHRGIYVVVVIPSEALGVRGLDVDRTRLRLEGLAGDAEAAQRFPVAVVVRIEEHCRPSNGVAELGGACRAGIAHPRIAGAVALRSGLIGMIVESEYTGEIRGALRDGIGAEVAIREVLHELADGGFPSGAKHGPAVRPHDPEEVVTVPVAPGAPYGIAVSPPRGGVQEGPIAGAEELFGSLGARAELGTERLRHHTDLAFFPILDAGDRTPEFVRGGGAARGVDVLPDFFGGGDADRTEIFTLVVVLDTQLGDAVHLDGGAREVREDGGLGDAGVEVKWGRVRRRRADIAFGRLSLLHGPC